MSKRVLLAAAAVVVVGAGATVWIVSRGNSSSSTANAAKTVTTAAVTQRDLTLYDETTATLGFTTSVTVSSPVAGTVTSEIGTGTRVDPGTVIATVDGAPLVALLGDVPSYRSLSYGVADGIDVRQLETNLVLLGFDPTGAITIDNHFDSATADAVAAWENSLGLAGDGTVPQGEVVYIPGHLLVDTVSVPVGGAVGTGGALMVARQTERSYLVAATGANGGAIDHVVAAGTPVTTGTVLFWHGGFPVVAIEGDTTTTPQLTRDLSTSSGNGVDVRLLEQMLVVGGFDPDKAIVVDDHFDTATAAAVQRWWTKLGIAADANSITVPAGSFVVVPGNLTAGAALTAEGTVPAGDAVVLGLTKAARQVTTSAPIGSATFVLGAQIDVQFPDGTISKGTVVQVGTVATNSNQNNPNATPTVAITLNVPDIPASVDNFVQIPVTLRVVSKSEKNAFVVPVSALVALAEGGFAIEVVNADPAAATPTSLIAVTPGLFADGFVSVTGGQLAAGLKVVVPS